LVLSYHFKGNIRQLKNLVYDMAITAESNLITNIILQKYLPKVGSPNVPMLLEKENAHTQQGFSDRDLLYKVLFDMRKDVTELKKLVLQMLNTGIVGKEMIQQHQDLFQEVEELHTFEETPTEKSAIMKVNPIMQLPSTQKNEENLIEDISHETEEETLSLEKKEKEIIIKALKQHSGKRKNAADDLGISERTLYRKIKKYNLE
ncbi:MAG: helix-turn-helix domain-containing protein, partial [Thermonemataceae bacterium]|nr:helix-turn-helix domain-containing protein [Thermonemataceae bacterium]